jgi:hypothetical protein
MHASVTSRDEARLSIFPFLQFPLLSQRSRVEPGKSGTSDSESRTGYNSHYATSANLAVLGRCSTCRTVGCLRVWSVRVSGQV